MADDVLEKLDGAPAQAPPGGARLRPRLSRTVAFARWREYEGLLITALEHGYRVMGVESWVAGGDPGDAPVLALRHDVDQQPRAALKMAEVERHLGVRSAWYFRWRTAERRVLDRLRGGGGTVGLHYESLSRIALDRGARTASEIEALIPEARSELREEIATFRRMFGPIRSICPHGDSRISLARNAGLLQDQDLADLGVEFDVNEAMRGRGIASWLTDRSRAEGHWGGEVDPRALLAERLSPVLCVVHPNNWSSGPSLWLDRMLRTADDEPPG